MAPTTTTARLPRYRTHSLNPDPWLAAPPRLFLISYLLFPCLASFSPRQTVPMPPNPLSERQRRHESPNRSLIRPFTPKRILRLPSRASRSALKPFTAYYAILAALALTAHPRNSLPSKLIGLLTSVAPKKDFLTGYQHFYDDPQPKIPAEALSEAKPLSPTLLLKCTAHHNPCSSSLFTTQDLSPRRSAHPKLHQFCRVPACARPPRTIPPQRKRPLDPESSPLTLHRGSITTHSPRPPHPFPWEGARPTPQHMRIPLALHMVSLPPSPYDKPINHLFPSPISNEFYPFFSTPHPVFSYSPTIPFPIDPRVTAIVPATNIAPILSFPHPTIQLFLLTLRYFRRSRAPFGEFCFPRGFD